MHSQYLWIKVILSEVREFSLMKSCVVEAAAKVNPKKADEEDDIIPSRLDLRVGKIVGVEKVGPTYIVLYFCLI